MHELDEVIKHVGVKGMKWGKRKKSSSDKAKKPNKLQKMAIKGMERRATIIERNKADRDVRRKVRSGEMTKKEGRQARWDNFHKEHSKNDPIYKKDYDRRISKGQDPKRAMKQAYRHSQRMQALKEEITSATFDAAVVVGKRMLENR